MSESLLAAVTPAHGSDALEQATLVRSLIADGADVSARDVPSPGTRPLDELDQVPWAELRHAHGPATDVPEQLRALVRSERERRTQAWDRMWSNLYHRGSIYEATLHAVPFLLHMLAEGTTPHPDRVLVYLRHLVVGEAEAELLPDGYDEAGFADWPQQDRELEAATHAAVAAGVPVIVPLLDHQDPGIAGEAAHLLAWFPGRATDILPALRRLSVRSPLPRSDRTTVLMAIGLLAGACGDRSDTAFLERMLADVDDPDRWAAAVALSRIATPDVPAAAIDVLVAELGAISADPEEYEMEPRTGFCFNSPEQLIVPTLHRLPAASRDAALDAAGRAIAGIENRDQVPWAEAADLVVLALGDAEPGSPDTLTPCQHAMRQALLTGDRIWASGQLGMRCPRSTGSPTPRTRWRNGWTVHDRGGRASAGGRLSVAAASVEGTDEMTAGIPGSSVLSP